MADATDLALCLSKAFSKLSSSTSNPTPAQASEALKLAQLDFEAIQFPRAQSVARASAKGMRDTFYKTAKEKGEEMSRDFEKSRK